MSKFIFISYKSEDRETVRPYLSLLDDLHIAYWWDQQIDGRWSDEIDKKLSECAAVVCFLTERAGASGPVYIECRTAADQKKLIPVRLDGAHLNYAFRSLLAFLNYIDLSGDAQVRINGEKDRLVRKIVAYLGTEPSPPEPEPSESSAARLGSWLSDPERQPHIAYVVALCFFEGQSHDMVQLCAARLEQKFNDAGLRRLFGLNEKLVVKTHKLKLVGAGSISYRSRMLAHDIETVRYVDQQFGEDVLLFVWNELDQLKAPIVDWLHDMVEHAPEFRGDIAATLSKLGRRNFHSIFSNVLYPWLTGSAGHFRCADIALSLIASDPDMRGYIRARLFAVADTAGETTNASKSGVAPPPTSDEPASDETGGSLSLDTAILLATGYTGMAMPDLAIAVFKKLESMLLDPRHSAEDFDATILPMRHGLRFTLKVSRFDEYARSMLKVFARGIYEWTLADNAISDLPEFIFCILLEDVTVGRDQRDTISLARLLTLDGTIEKLTVDAFASVIASALESKNKFIHERYKVLLKAWRNNLAPHKGPQVVQPALDVSISEDRKAFAALVDAATDHATTEDDRERIRFCVKHV